jgi:hypothetical protein
VSTIRPIQERGIRNHVNLDERTRSLIVDATSDLYNGPGCDTSAQYPGFTAACREIRAALPRRDLWVTDDGFVSETEPEWYRADGEPQECPDAWTLVEASTVKRILVGQELAAYV